MCTVAVVFAFVARLKVLGYNEKKLRFTQSFHGDGDSDGDGPRSELYSHADILFFCFLFLLFFFLSNPESKQQIRPVCEE